VTVRPSWLFAGAPLIALLGAGCSGEPAMRPLPSSETAKQPPVYSSAAEKVNTSGKVKGKRQLNTTGPRPGRLVD
jgi:hypothetical protein